MLFFDIRQSAALFILRAYSRYYICMRHYFDYAAATPLAPEVEKTMRPYWSKVFGNPGALHWFGQESSATIFKARETIAKSLGCSYREIIFTGSATEANNLALRGAVRRILSAVSNKEAEGDKTTRTLQPKIIISSIEHDSILDTAHELEKEGVEVQILPVDVNGVVNLKKLESLLDDRTVLVSVMYANNEIGTIQPIHEISKIINDFRNHSNVLSVVNDDYNKRALASARASRTLYPLFHTDAVQAFNYLNCNVNDLGVDMMTLSSQKIYGPKGVGLLYVRKKTEMRNQKSEKTKSSSLISHLSYIAPIITGGGQEYGLRSGTENVPGIVGLARAVEMTDRLRKKESSRIKKMQDYFIAQIKKKIPKVQFNGGLGNRLPNNINMYIPDSEGQDLIIKLDLAGFAVSPGAACSARTCSPSHVLKALGCSDERATNSIRITFGRQTDKAEIDLLIREITRLIL